ncbi:TetR/AcrR family transcriptional regulator [Microbacterium gorillae]|uniref:TetR/AcrR family transcriptional regulator n=1 Tax=Microbacterium gorillae TaxID=1231063 RepID=UPI00058FE3B4|nr:TetR/AcrR family transcriptional regulator [Microbacterium gorillae]
MTDDAAEPELPRAIALAWGVAVNPQRGPKRELSIERIVDAAIEIADADGLGAVSMSRVATTLGFTTMSLYRYVTSKDDLLLLMQEVATEIAIPEADTSPTWRAGLERWVRSLRAAYHEHPWLSDIPISGPPITPNSLALVDWFLRETRELPLSDAERMGALLLLSNYSTSVVRQERDVAALDPGDASGQNFLAGIAPMITPERFPDFAPFFARGGYLGDPTVSDSESDFTFGLGRILDGLERRIETTDDHCSADPSESAPPDVAADDAEPLPRDPAVRAANRERRDAERRVREVEKELKEARKRERDAIRKARDAAAERARKDAERAAKDAERAAKRS